MSGVRLWQLQASNENPIKLFKSRRARSVFFAERVQVLVHAYKKSEPLNVCKSSLRDHNCSKLNLCLRFPMLSHSIRSSHVVLRLSFLPDSFLTSALLVRAQGRARRGPVNGHLLNLAGNWRL